MSQNATLSATLHRIAEDPQNRIRSSDQVLLHMAARELEDLADNHVRPGCIEHCLCGLPDCTGFRRFDI